jgi:arsenical pump membrane protein
MFLPEGWMRQNSEAPVAFLFYSFKKNDRSKIFLSFLKYYNIMTSTLILLISLLAIAGVIIRPFGIPEYISACAGAAILLLSGLLKFSEGISGFSKGIDVYFFLTGMMMLAETARIEGMFDWLAAHAAKLAKGSSTRLFFLIYLVGTLVTIFLSNDATAVVLTPAVIAAVRASKVKNPLPYLFICAFIANAASFVLPISNPANLVIYGSHLPDLRGWLSSFLIPSIVSIIATFIVLYILQRKALRESLSTDINIPILSGGGKAAIGGIFLSAVILTVSSAWGISLGLPTFISGMVTVMIVCIGARRSPLTIAKGVSWNVLPLVAGLFIIVEAFGKTGLTRSVSELLTSYAQGNVAGAAWGSGIITAVVCNLMNNLPAGLTASSIVHSSAPPEIIRRAILIGIDLGPNLSLTGSLASILWLVALRRENLSVSGWSFLKLGAIVMTVPLLFVLASLFI